MTPARLTLLAAALGAALTAATAMLPFLRFAYWSPSSHVAIETAAVLVAGLTAFLIAGRFGRTARLDDLALFGSLSLFAASNLAFALAPKTLFSAGDAAQTWAPLAGRLLATCLFVVAAFAPARAVVSARRAYVLIPAAAVATVAVVALAVHLLAPHLPDPVDDTLSPELSSRPFLVGSLGLLTAQLLGVGLFALAAAGFARKAPRSDPLMRLLGPAAAVHATAALNYFLFPSLYTGWVYTGDAFRLGFYALLLGAAGAEVRAYWQRVADGATAEERRRIARDLHDGAARELAFVATQARRAARDPRRDTLEALAAAADRALDESRRAIDALTAAPQQSLDAAIARAAELVAHRMGARLRLDLPDHVDADPATREELVRIVREAVTNAVRHGGADAIAISLTPEADRVRLRIADGGRGFSTERRHAGFGLTTMRERAALINATLTIVSAPGSGTTVEVLV